MPIRKNCGTDFRNFYFKTFGEFFLILNLDLVSKGPFIATQLNSTELDVELSCVAIDTLTDATQLSPTIGNATDPGFGRYVI